MKKLLLFLLLPLFSFSQNLESDSITIFTNNNSNDDFYKNYNTSICYGNERSDLSMFKNQIIYVVNIFKCEKKFVVGCYLLGDYGYLILDENSDKKFLINDMDRAITIQELYPLFEKISDERKDDIRKRSEKTSSFGSFVLKEKLGSDILKYKKNTIAIIRANPTENYSMTGAEFEIMNFSTKTIKYATFNFYGKNKVKDKVQYRSGVYNVSKKGIGPVEQYSHGSWNFDTVWLTDTVHTLDLISINIQFMDGTSKLIKVTNEMWIDEDLLYQFEKVSEQNRKVENNY